MEKDILDLIQKSQDGIEIICLSSIASEQLHIEDQSTIDAAVATLASDRRIVKKGNRWVASNNQKNDISKYFEEIGGPHSEKGMETLNEFLLNYKEEIVLLLDVTSVTAFSKLPERLEKNYLTEVILPPTKEINKGRKDYYKKIKQEWIKFYKEHKKNCFTLRQASVINRAIRTTLFCNEKARINIRMLSKDDHSTRNGCIIVVEKNNTLYEQFANEIKIQRETASFYFRANSFKWILEKIIKSWLLIVISASMMVLAIFKDCTIASAIMGVCTGITGNFLYERLSFKKKFG